MTFADDDLKRLKEWDASAMKADDEEVWGEFKDELCKKFPALLARLEAAEFALDGFDADEPTVVIDARLNLWRKAAGK